MEKIKIGKINAVDIIIFLLLAVVIIKGVSFLTPKSVSADTKTNTPIKYTIELYKSEPTLLEKVQVGTTVYDYTKGYEIGKIVGVYEEPYSEDVPDFDNNIFKKTEIEPFKYVYVEVEANAKITEQTTSVGDFEVLVGNSIYVNTDKFAAGGFVVKVEGNIN